MPLHRDIHWIGRQWAVTGHGMQLIDQKLQGFFDIEVDRLWDDALIESVHAKEWLNTGDFDKGLALARARYPQPSGAATPPPVAPLPPIAKSIEPKPEPARLETPKPVAPAPAPAPVEPPTAIMPPRQAAPPPPILKPSEPKPVPAKLEIAKPAAPIRTPPARVEPPSAVTLPRQAAPAPSPEPIAALPPEAPRKTLKLGAPEPVTVTLVKRRPVETPVSARPTQAAAPAAAQAAVPAGRNAPERVVFVKPGVIEPLRTVAQPPTTAIGTNASTVEPSLTPFLFQMRYECRAKFVRPWRVVTKRPT